MTEESAATEWRRGWPVVASATVGYGAGVAVFNMCAGLFIRPMQQDLGWSTSAVTIGPIVIVMMALCNPVAGFVVDRRGARPTAIWGLLLLAVAVSALAFVPAEKFALFSLAVIIGLVGPLSNGAPFLKGVASWFVRSSGTAFGVTANGASLVALVALPIVSATIYHFGWRSGYLAIVGIALLLGLPPVLGWFRENPRAVIRQQATVDHAGLSLGEAIRRHEYWFLILAIAVASIPVGGFMISLMPLMGERGLSITAATTLGMVFALAISVGRIGGGILLDRFHPGKVVPLMLLAAGAGAALLAAAPVEGSFAMIAVAVALIGMGQGVEADLIAFFTLKMFGLKAYSTIFGTIAMVAGLAVAVGGSMFAFSQDLTGSYGLAVKVGAACYALSGIIFLIMFQPWLRPTPVVATAEQGLG